MNNNPYLNKMLLSAEVISKKFVLREAIIFLLRERMQVMGDKEIVFSGKDFIDFVSSCNKNVLDSDITDVLTHLTEFYKRDSDNTIIEPRTKLLEFKEMKEDKFVVSGCTTDDLKNILRFIDISVYLGERPENYEEESLFGMTQDGKISFLDRESVNPLGNKEKAIFNLLRSRFGQECDYKDLFEAVLRQQTASRRDLKAKYNTEPLKKDFINGGIRELRKKLLAISGNPYAIETMPGRDSVYKLMY